MDFYGLNMDSMDFFNGASARYFFLDFLPIHKWFTRYRSLDHFPNREVIGFKVIHHFLNQREIRETHIAAEGVTKQPFDDRSGYGAFFFHQRLLPAVHILESFAAWQFAT